MHVFVLWYKRRDPPELISQERVGPPPGRGMVRRSHKPNARDTDSSRRRVQRRVYQSQQRHKARSASVVARASTRKGTCRIAIPLLDRPSSNASIVTRSYSELLEELIAPQSRALVDSIFIALISLSISSMNCTTKSMSLCFHMASRLKLVNKKETS